MNTSQRNSFLAAAETWDFGYNPPAKEYFHREGKKLLRDLAKQLGFSAGAYKIHSNHGGIAVSGEVILDSDTLYLWLTEKNGPADFGVWFRRSSGQFKRGERKFHGPNHHMHFGELTDSRTAVIHINEAINEPLPLNDYTARQVKCPFCK